MTTTAQKFKVITRDELKAKLDSGTKFHLWNVLKPEYYHADKNIPGSKWVPVTELDKHLPTLNVSKSDEIVVYCGSFTCPSSKQAAEKLVHDGYTNVSAFEGGVHDWEEAGFPFSQAS